MPKTILYRNPDQLDSKTIVCQTRGFSNGIVASHERRAISRVEMMASYHQLPKLEQENVIKSNEEYGTVETDALFDEFGNTLVQRRKLEDDPETRQGTSIEAEI